MRFDWWPKSIPLELVPAIRRLGKRGLRYREVPDNGGELAVKGLHPGTIEFADLDNVTLAEQRTRKTVGAAPLLSLAAVLAEGPKLFVIPPDMIDDLNQVEIPLPVEDYSQPFPAVIVKSGDEYHFAVNVDRRIFVVTINGGIVDFIGFMDSTATIEKYFSDGGVWHYTKGCLVKMTDAEDVILPHRFRATLNFLLLVVAGGFTFDSQRMRMNKPKQRKEYDPAKYLIPSHFVPQEINLWRKRLIDANHPTNSDGSGAKKSPHWRRVATGIGRANRELRLIAACLVNRKCLITDAANSEYVCH